MHFLRFSYFHWWTASHIALQYPGLGGGTIHHQCYDCLSFNDCSCSQRKNLGAGFDLDYDQSQETVIFERLSLRACQHNPIYLCNPNLPCPKLQSCFEWLNGTSYAYYFYLANLFQYPHISAANQHTSYFGLDQPNQTDFIEFGSGKMEEWTS